MVTEEEERHRAQRSRTVKEQEHAFTISSWNVAGMSATDVASILTRDSVAEITVLQEYPKSKQMGWRKTQSDHLEIHTFSNFEMYRGVGIALDARKWMLIQRTDSTRGCWGKLRCRHTGRIVWIGTCHLPRNEWLSEFERHLHGVLQCGPADDEPAVLMGDVNTHQGGVRFAEKYNTPHRTADKDFCSSIPLKRDFCKQGRLCRRWSPLLLWQEDRVFPRRRLMLLT